MPPFYSNGLRFDQLKKVQSLGSELVSSPSDNSRNIAEFYLITAEGLHWELAWAIGWMRDGSSTRRFPPSPKKRLRLYLDRPAVQGGS